MKPKVLRNGIILLAAMGMILHGYAAAIVEYVNPVSSGTDGHQNFSMPSPASATNGTLIVNNWIATGSPIMDASIYGNYQSHPLYAIVQTGDDNGPGVVLNNARLVSQGAGAYEIQLVAQDSDPSHTLSMSALVFVKSEDFSNNPGDQPLAELSMSQGDTEVRDAGSVRFAILNAGQWYVSASNSPNSNASFTLSNPQDANQWGAITPATGSSDSIVTPAGVTFDTAGSALTSIDAIGVYYDGIQNTPNATRVRLELQGLTADTAGFVPSSDSARVLASNVDEVKGDFEYVKPGIVFGMSLSAALNGAASGGSTDESYGSFYDPSGAVAAPEAYPWKANGANSLVADLTVTNTSGAKNIKLDGLYFDINRSSTTAIRQIRLDYIGGDLGATGQVYNTTLADTASTNLWKSCDLTFASAGDVPGLPDLGFNAMPDVILGANESATFRLTLQTSTDAATEPGEMRVDNIALIGDFVDDNVLVDWSSPGMFFGEEGTAELRLNAYTDQTNGTLYVRNFVSTDAIMDRFRAGYYQAQDLYGILQTGNKGALAQNLDFAFSRIANGGPASGEMNLNASSLTNSTDVFQSSLVFVNAEDFYDKLEAGETISSLQMNVSDYSMDAGKVRFAVKNDGQWYASLVKIESAGLFNMKFPALENAWGAFTPATASSAILMTDAGIAYNVSGSSLTNIDAVGFLILGEDLNPSDKVTVKVDSFKVLAGPVLTDLPDPSVLAFNVDNNREDFEYVKSGVDFSLTLLSTGPNPSDSLGSRDGSLGSFYDPNSANTNNAQRPWAGRGDNELIAEMTLANIAPNTALNLSGFHFDLYRANVAYIAARQVELEYIGGDLAGVPTGLVYRVVMTEDEFVPYDATNVVEGVTNITTVIPWADFDWTFASEGNTPSVNAPEFNALADTVLAYGESATFRFTVKSSTDPVTEQNQTRLDNIAFLGSLVSVGYGGWINGFGLPNDQKDEGDDYDMDGINNLYEYGFNGNPNDGVDLGTLPVYGAVSGVFTYVHPQRADYGNDIIYYLELNDNLVYGSWTNAGYTIAATNVTGSTLDLVTNEISTVSKDAQFIRLIVERQ